jgi:hypothetical protein
MKKELTGDEEGAQRRAFVIAITNIQAHLRAVNLLTTLLSKPLTFQGILFNGVNHSGNDNYCNSSCFGRNGITLRIISAVAT